MYSEVDSSGGPSNGAGENGRAARARTLSRAEGSLANILPLVEEPQATRNQGEAASATASTALLGNAVEAAKGAKKDSLPTQQRGRSASDFSLDFEESDLEEFGVNRFTAMRDFSAKTPGEIRMGVLEWMYDEKDLPCPDLSLSNAPILEDLISVFVTTVLHGKSDFIRAQVWRFLTQCSVNSLHFAFMVICNLNASCHQPQDLAEDEVSLDYRRKRVKDLSAIESVILTLKTAVPEAVPANSNATNEPRETMLKAIDQLEAVHDNQVLTNLDLNVRGRTARQNIDLLVQKIRSELLRKGAAGHEQVKELDGKIGFIKTMTDLDDWMIRSVARGDRAQILKQQLATIGASLAAGAYMPTATSRAGVGHRILRLVPEEAIVFNTARKCPFLLVAEVEAVLSEEVREVRSPRGVALDALEMVSTRDFWKNPIKQIKSFNERRQSASLSTGGGNVELQPISSGADSDVASHSAAAIRRVGDKEDDKALARAEAGKEEADALQERTRGNEDVEADGDAEVEADAALKPHRGKKKEQERWEEMEERLRSSSPFGHLPNWQLASMFIKAGDDLRQQQLGVLFVSTFQKIFLEERVPVWLNPYKVISTGRMCGLLEPARNSDSFARIKERGKYNGIDEYFLDTFGPKTSPAYKRAQKNFLHSLAGYSIVAYLIKLNDRHNGNCLLDLEGHFYHIDFGFMLGHYHKLELSPFKLTSDMLAVLGGAHSDHFLKFRRLMEKAFIAANKHYRELVLLAELMSVDASSSECFAGGRRWVIDEFKERFQPHATSTRQLKKHINSIINQSMENYTTRCYDCFQYWCEGIH